MNLADLQYIALCEKILAEGEERADRTGTGTLSIFSHQMTFDMSEGFPLLTTKDMSMSFKHVVAEMLWMLKGSTNANELADMGFSIWKKWADENGELGPVYGHQWRHFNAPTDILTGKPYSEYGEEVDQIRWVLNELRVNPHSRRMLVSAWNPNQLEDMALPPCHWSFELYVDFDKHTLNMKLHQRSCDVFLGVPYNIAEYALLLHILSIASGYKAGILIHDMTNVHIYKNHIPQIKEQITRDPFMLPDLVLAKGGGDPFSYKVADFGLTNYTCHPKLTGEVSV
jgi:thymidylate synthase